jgi:N-acetylglucosaminyldiphosphoundecaprenol N-acetyl-beta-D-mannosaminyltransferase
MIDTKKIYNFRIGINTFTLNEYLEIIEKKIIDRDEIIVQTGVNAYTIVCIQKDVVLRETINKSTLVNIDGMPVAWALKFLGNIGVSKVSCPDLFNGLIKLASEKGYRPFFLGTTPEILEKAVNKLTVEYPKLQIAGSHHGFFDENDSKDIAEIIKKSNADMLFVGMTSPKKELFSEKYAQFMQVPYTFGVGGVFDIIAGKTKRAPLWMQNSGLEWFYRFIQEPQRMWRRYLIGNIKFIWIVLKEKF